MTDEIKKRLRHEFFFKEHSLLICILLIAGISRIIRYLLCTRIDKDAIAYIHIAENILRGNTDAAFAPLPRVPPLYVFLMAQISSYTGWDVEFTGALISVIAGTLTVLPVFYIAKAFFRNKIAVISALIVAVHPYLIRLSADVLRDSLFIFLFISSITFVVYAVKYQKFLYWYIGGIFTALATLTRSEGIEIIIAMALWIILELIISLKTNNTKNKEIWLRIKNFAGGFLAFCMMFLAVALPAQQTLIKTDSVWTIVDTRIISVFHGFFNIPSRKVYKKIRGK